ncbi:MAG: hypothetical protein GY703_08540 [Gammaproteobacteria bacterium]|nr:hypothetical protein [Gammaproteobacteria bacterium]
MLNDIAVRLYRRFFWKPGAGKNDTSANSALDGNSAAVLTEAGICSAACLTGNGSPAENLWRQLIGDRKLNAFGDRLQALESEGPRGAIAAAAGYALAGRRCTVFLSGADLAGCPDLLSDIADRHLPMVIHGSNQSAAQGSSHDTSHQIVDSGCFILYAANVQQVADLSLIARRVAETALIPGVLLMDGTATANSAQELSFFETSVVTEFLTPPDGEIPSPSPAQQLLFGETRRSVPLWHDPGNPMLSGSRLGSAAFSLGAAGHGPYFKAHLNDIIDQACERFAELSGRHYGSLSIYRVEDADRIVLIQGSAVEPARAAADHLRQHHDIKTGVIGIRCLRPFPAARLLEHLSGKSDVVVMERSDTGLAAHTPLLGEVRAALAKALENKRFGGQTHPGYPELETQQLPRLHSAIYGMSGAPPRGGDLVDFLGNLDQRKNSKDSTFLGVSFYSSSAAHPKRQVLLDQIRRAYPHIGELGLQSQRSDPDLTSDDALTVDVCRLFGRGATGLTAEAAALLQRTAGGIIRTLPGLKENDCAGWVTDQLYRAPGGPGYPGAGAPVDLALITTPDRVNSLPAPDFLRDRSTLLLVEKPNDREVWPQFNRNFRRLAMERQCVIYRLPEPEFRTLSSGSLDPREEELDDAYLLGGLFGVLTENGMISVARPRILSAWEESLSGADDQQRGALLAAFDNGMKAPERLKPEAVQVGDMAEPAPWDDTPPLAVRQLGSTANTYDSLPRFWDQVGVLYRNGEQDDLTVDPFMVIGAIPPLTSTFRDLGDLHRELPVFDPAACTGCGACWTACPDSAIGASLLTPTALLDDGIRRAGADAVRQVASKLASRIGSLCSEGLGGKEAGALVGEAWAWLEQKAPLPDARRIPLQNGIDELVRAFGKQPLAVTDALFQSLEKKKKGDGALLSLVINPDTCKACGLCVQTCEDQALSPGPRSPDLLQEARTLWRSWEEMTGTPAALIDKVTAEGNLDPLAARLLSRESSRLLAGGDGAEPGSGEKVTLRLALAAMDYRQRPKTRGFSRSLGELEEQLRQAIRETLSEALPSDDLNLLTENLRDAGSRLLEMAAGDENSQLNQLVELARSLDAARQHLPGEKGDIEPSGLSLVISPGSISRWACAFPNNPFHLPVTLDRSGDAAQLVSGLAQGQLVDLQNYFALHRKARRLLDSPDKTGSDSEIPTWTSLTEEERAACAPVILAGNELELGGRGLAQVIWLLNSGIPVKILIMCEMDLGLDNRAHRAGQTPAMADPRTDLGLMALAQRNAFVAQSSFAEPRHFCKTLDEAVSFDGPALIRIHTPSPSRHGFPTHQTIEQARQAIRCRAFPLFRYDPCSKGVFGTRVSLEGNPALQSTWAEDQNEDPLTPASWAFGESRFAGHFTPAGEDDETPLALHEWLLADEPDQARTTPVQALSSEHAGTGTFRISPELAKRSLSLSQSWRMLQELAGVVTPFTETVNREAEQRVAGEHQATLDQLQADHDSELAALKEGLQGRIAEQIQERLLVLAGYK